MNGGLPAASLARAYERGREQKRRLVSREGLKRICPCGLPITGSKKFICSCCWQAAPVEVRRKMRSWSSLHRRGAARQLLEFARSRAQQP